MNGSHSSFDAAHTLADVDPSVPRSTPSGKPYSAQADAEKRRAIDAQIKAIKHNRHPQWYTGWSILNRSGYGDEVRHGADVAAALKEWRALWQRPSWNMAPYHPIPRNICKTEVYTSAWADALAKSIETIAEDKQPPAVLPQLLQSKEDAIEAVALAKAGCNPNARNMIDANIKRFIGTLDGQRINMGFGCYIEKHGTDVKLCERHAGALIVGVSLLPDEPVRLVYKVNELDTFLAKVPEAAPRLPFGSAVSTRTGTLQTVSSGAK